MFPLSPLLFYIPPKDSSHHSKKRKNKGDPSHHCKRRNNNGKIKTIPNKINCESFLLTDTQEELLKIHFKKKEYGPRKEIASEKSEGKKKEKTLK